MENKVLQRIRIFIKSKNITIKAFGESIDISEGTLKSMFNRGTNPSADMLIKIANEYPDISLRWLLKGDGSMLNASNSNPLQHAPVVEEASTVREPLAEYLPTSNFKLVPLINLDIAGGTTNQEIDTAQYVEKYIPFVDAQSGDIACPVTNNSMSPIYPPGTIVQIRKIKMWKEYIEYGQVYVVDLVDNRRLIKQVKKGSGKDRFVLSSFNKDYDDNEINVDMIYSMWLVIAKYEKVVM
ncbi:MULTISPECIES: S24 family peptidase [unclassified Dysgonomonas]|uniref:XRE family transcriptional regulator n=1 Tax=unclassified Dysgonomonas TaxID=2630389 RepID=UPI00247365CC|nr:MULTISPECIES: S24 family peptidase [unclassified Dysgonomonas]